MVQTDEAKAREGAVTPERFAKGKTYEEYMGSIQQNQAKFKHNFENTKVPEEYAKRLQAVKAKPNGVAKVLVVGEDWCPDVYRGLPVIKRVADAAGWELRVMERDQNLDVAEQFKKDGQFLSVPTVIFFTADGKYVSHWIERPERVSAEMGDVTRPLFAKYSPQALAAKLGREPNDEEKAEAAKARGKEYDEFQMTNPAWARWRDVTVEDLTEWVERATT